MEIFFRGQPRMWTLEGQHVRCFGDKSGEERLRWFEYTAGRDSKEQILECSDRGHRFK